MKKTLAIVLALVLSLSALVFAVACGSNDDGTKVIGSEGGLCHADGTCATGLTCQKAATTALADSATSDTTASSEATSDTTATSEETSDTTSEATDGDAESTADHDSDADSEASSDKGGDVDSDADSSSETVDTGLAGSVCVKKA